MSRHSSKVYSTGGRIERSIVKHLHKLRDGLLPGEAGVKAYALLNPFKLKFHCPICDYRGPFFDSYRRSAGQRPHARCPRCDSMERHRLQFLVVQRLAQRYDFASMSMLHMAPEKFFMELFRRQFGAYVGANLQRNRGVDLQANLCALPFCDGQFDAIYASHILEHIKNDLQAILEVKRVLREGGLAVLPVPVVVSQTIEYPEPNPYENEHVRAPGPDYYDRYRDHFSTVEIFSSDDFPPEYQLHKYEDRTIFPHELSPWRTPMAGKCHPDMVAVCFR